MTASPSDLIAGITPGSLEYGKRAPLEAGLLAGGGGGTATPGAIGAPSLPQDSVQDPIAALLSGDIDPGGQTAPLTSGLSVGPGPGSLGDSPAERPVKVRLQNIASTAASPLTRAMARNELRRLVREAV